MRLHTAVLSAIWAFVMILQAAPADEPIKATVGEHKIVMPAGFRELNYFPDEPISILKKKPFAPSWLRATPPS